jgi:hypothetical protein
MSSEEQSSSPTENETPENYREAFQVSDNLESDLFANL